MPQQIALSQNAAGNPISNRPQKQVLAWVDIFGTAEASPPSRDTLTQENSPPFDHDYILKGLFASPQASWAILADSKGDFLVRVGDTLSQDIEVSTIDADGVWIETPQGQELIGFVD